MHNVAAAGLVHTLAVKSNGTLWAWGQNGNGILGDEQAGSQRDFDSANRNRPVQIGTDRNWMAISAGHTHSLALKANGTLWAWGGGFQGQLGDGTTGRSFTPEQIGGAADWKSVRAGASHTVALKMDGSLWAWGSNFRGQLGNSSTVDQLVPVRIGSAKNWVWASGGVNYSVALKADGSLWIWGAKLVDRKTGHWVDLQRLITRFGLPIRLRPQAKMDLVPVNLTDVGELPLNLGF